MSTYLTWSMESELIGKHVVGQELPAIAHALAAEAIKDEVAICGAVPAAALHGAGAPEMPKRLMSTLASEIVPWSSNSRLALSHAVGQGGRALAHARGVGTMVDGDAFDVAVPVGALHAEDEAGHVVVEWHVGGRVQRGDLAVAVAVDERGRRAEDARLDGLLVATADEADVAEVGDAARGEDPEA